MFDIEDFGVVLSFGITCPQHDWSFDLHTGKADRGSYKLKVWEVQVRRSEAGEDTSEVWVRRRQRIG
jgi:nitrite reductase/ring-hydroxylating ferredoxin subunit